MKNLLGLFCLYILLSVQFLKADIVFSEDFTQVKTATDRFTTHGQATFNFSDKSLIIATRPGGSYFRTNGGNSFPDDGTQTITYSVKFQSDGARDAGLIFRMDDSGAATNDTTNANPDTGYMVEQYYDGNTGILFLYRLNKGTAVVLFKTEVPQVTGYAGTLSVTVKNSPSSVDCSIKFNGIDVGKYSDISTTRIANGKGIGGVVLNNGATRNDTQFFELRAVSSDLSQH